MNQNIIIQEGGTNYQFTAKKLKTNKVGGGTCLWIPEDESSDNSGSGCSDNSGGSSSGDGTGF